MKCNGDIRVWVDGQRACARLTAEGHDGPIVVQASAPLADVRRRVERRLQENGHAVSGDHPGFNALVNGVARSTALHRLEALAPALFVPGGVATFLAIRELKRRRRARELAKRRELEMKRIATDEARDFDEEFEDDDRDDEDDDGDRRSAGPYGDTMVGWHRPRNAPTRASIGATQAQATNAALTVAQMNPQVRAGVSLIRFARRNPRARRQMNVIASRAQAGDPRARAQMRVLAKAKRVDAAERQKKAPPPRRSRTVRGGRGGHSALAASPTAAAEESHGLRRIFWPWDPELIRRRGA